MKKEFATILLTGLVSTLIAVLQSYLLTLGHDATTSAVPAFAGMNGVLLAMRSTVFLRA